MCGIFAILGDRGDMPIETMRSYFNNGKKRGPEFSSLTNISYDILWGFHRLCINGLDEISNQPISAVKSVMMCNGEIYNHKELVQKSGLTMSTNSDCEIIARLYELYGTNFVNLLDGVFAFIIYDVNNGDVIVGRDPYGVRPLYVCKYSSGMIGFASDLSTLLFDQKIDTIEQVEPGTISKYNKNVGTDNKFALIEKERYFYSISKVSITEDLGIEYYMYNAVNLLEKSVSKRVQNCERDIASLLSGGLDSSIISALVSLHYFKKTGRSLKTYSIGLKDAVDLQYARMVSDHIGSVHSEVVVDNQYFLDTIPKVIEDIESYDTTTVRASVGNWNIAKYIRENSDAKVVFNGDGADELMGGYLYFHCAPDDSKFHEEEVRLLSDISKYDVLRSDKSISSHGLEPRTPFLDKEFTKFYLSIPIKYRNHCNEKNIEKYFIRKAIELYKPDLLPPDVLWRVKEAFSDGVSSASKAWYEVIQDSLVDYESLSEKDLYNEPKTNEQMYYRNIFDKSYPGCSKLIPYFWMPRFIEGAHDASARTLQVYQEMSKL